MTAKQEIEALKLQVTNLEERIKALEARPYYPYYYVPYTQPYPFPYTVTCTTTGGTWGVSDS